MPAATKKEFLQNYNSKYSELYKSTKVDHNEVAQTAHELLAQETDFDNLSLVEKAELVRLLDTKYTNLNESAAADNFQKLWQKSMQLLQTQENKDEKPKNIKWIILVLFSQIMIMAAVLLMLGLLLTNPIMAIAIGKIAATFALHIYSSYILPFLILNAFNLSIILPLLALAVVSTKIVDYMQSRKDEAEAQKEKEKNAIEYYKAATKRHKPEQVKKAAGVVSEALKTSTNIKKPTSKQPAEKIELEKQLKAAEDKLEKEALERYTNALTEIKPNDSTVEDKSPLAKFLASVAKPQEAKSATKDLTPRPWYKRLFSSDIKSDLTLINLATACKLLDSTKEGQTSSLTASEKTVCKLLKNNHSDYDLYSAGFSIRDIKFAIENSGEDENSAHNLFLTMYNEYKLPEVVISNEVDDNTKEIAAIEVKLIALKEKLNTLEVTEQHVEEALDLDREEKSTLTERNQEYAGTNEDTKKSIRQACDDKAYKSYTKKSGLIAFKAEKSSGKQLADIVKIKAEIIALQSMLSIKIDDLSSTESLKQIAQASNHECYQIFDTESFLASENAKADINLTSEKDMDMLSKYFINIPHITDSHNIKALSKIAALPSNKKEYIASELRKAYVSFYESLETGKQGHATIEEFNEIVEGFVMNYKTPEDISDLKAMLDRIDFIQSVNTHLNSDSTRTFTKLSVKANQSLKAVDPDSKNTIDLLYGLSLLEMEHNEREDLSKSGSFLGRQLIEHMAHATLQDVPTVMINQEQFNSNPETIGFNNMFCANTNNTFKPNETGTGSTNSLIINPKDNATTVAAIVALPSHYIAITFHKTADSWTAYVVDSFGHINGNKVAPIIAKFKEELNLPTDVNIVYSTHYHQVASECGIHALENIRAVADTVKKIEEINERLIKIEENIQDKVQTATAALTQENLNQVIQENSDTKKKEATEKQTTRRELMFIQALVINPKLRTTFNIIPGNLLTDKDPKDAEETASNNNNPVECNTDDGCFSAKDEEPYADKIDLQEAKENNESQLITTKKQSSTPIVEKIYAATTKQSVNKVETLISTQLFIAVNKSLKLKGKKEQDEAIKRALTDFKQKGTENKITNDIEIFKDHIVFAKTQKTSLENKLKSLKKLKHAAEYSQASTRTQLLKSISCDIDTTENYIRDMEIQVDVLNFILSNNDNINSMMITGITEVYQTLTKYQDKPAALLPVKEKTELLDYQPKSSLRDIARFDLKKLFDGLANEKRKHEVKVELDITTVKEFNFDNSPAYKQFMQSSAYQEFSDTIKNIDKLNKTDIAEQAQEYCNKHRYIGPSASFFAPNHYMDDRAKSSKEEKIEILNTWLENSSK